jgi:hypothetical protein
LTKLEEAELILDQIQKQLLELIAVEEIQELTAEELVVLATEMATGLPVTTIEMGQPIGQVDRDRACFVIDEDLVYPLYGDRYYEQED